MPSQKQLRWAQLRVGLTVVFAAVVLMFLIFLMSGTTGLFTPTLHLISYVDNAGGLRNGAPVRLQNVDIGNVQKIRLVNHQDANGASTPVADRDEGEREVPTVPAHRFAGAAFHGGSAGRNLYRHRFEPGQGPRGLPTAPSCRRKEVPDIQDVVRSSQSTLQNVNDPAGRLDSIVSAVEDQKGSVGKLIYDKQLYNNLNSSVAQVNGMLNDINNGHGSLGKLMN